MYWKFCYYYRLEPLPADQWQLVRFARYIGSGVTSFDTVTGYMSTIKRIHELGGFPFPQDLHLLKLEMMALRRELAHFIKKAPPVSPELLWKIHQQVDMTKSVNVTAYAALVVGFTLFLRKSNLVPDTVTSFNPEEQLTVEDISMKNSVVMVGIKWSKTLQNRDRELVLPLIPAKNGGVCCELDHAHASGKTIPPERSGFVYL